MKKLSKKLKVYYYTTDQYYDGFLTDASSHAADLMQKIQEELDTEKPLKIMLALKLSKRLATLIEDELATLKEHTGKL